MDVSLEPNMTYAASNVQYDIASLMAFLSLIVVRTNVKSYTFVCDEIGNIAMLNKYWKQLQEVPQIYFNFANAAISTGHTRNGIVFVSHDHTKLQQIISEKPTLLVLPFELLGNVSLLDNIEIPTKTFFYLITGHEVYQILHPTTDRSAKMILVATGRLPQHWNWVADKEEIKHATNDLSGETVRVALTAKHTVSDSYIRLLFKNRLKNVLFFDKIEDYLKCRLKLVIDFIEPNEFASLTFESRTLTFLSNGHADIAADMVMISPDRAMTNDFIQTGIDLRYHFIVRKPEYIHSWKSPLLVFEMKLWFSLIPATILTALMLTYMTQKLGYRYLDISSCLILVFGYFCNQGFPNIPSNISIRMACLTCLAFTCIVYNTYVSNFYSYLSTHEIKRPFSSIEELIEKREYSLIIDPETSLYEALQKSKEGVLKNVWEIFLRDDPQHMMSGNNTKQVLERICTTKATLLSTHHILLTQRPCPMVALRPGYFPQSYCLITRKNFAFTHQFRFAMLRNLESGLVGVNKMKYTYMPPVTRTNTTMEPIGMEQIFFHLASYCVVLLISSVILALEIIHSKLHTRPTRSPNSNHLHIRP